MLQQTSLPLISSAQLEGELAIYARWARVMGVFLFGVILFTNLSLLRANDIGRHDIITNGYVQDIAFDKTGRYLYVQTVVGRGADETSIISRYALNGNSVNLVDSMPGIHWLGHQGIGVDVSTDGRIWIWGSSGHGGGRDAVRFEYRPTGESEKPQVYTLFSKNISKTGTTMPKPCNSSNLLAARGFTERSGQFVRIFDRISLMKGGAGDYSKKFKLEWKIPDSVFMNNTPLQGLACDRQYIYILLGADGARDVWRLAVFTIDGALVSIDESFYKLEDRAAASENTHFEPEGIALRSSSRESRSDLYFGFVESGRWEKKLNVKRINFEFK